MSTVYVWRDANVNAVADPGEVVPAVSLLEWIAVDPTEVVADTWAAEGAKLIDGAVVPSWDWWSLPYKSDYYDEKLPVTVIPEEASGSGGATVYQWLDVKNQELSGLLRFFEVDGLLYVAVLGPDFIEIRLIDFAPVKTGFDSKTGHIFLTWKFYRSEYAMNARVSLLPNGEIRASASSR